MLRQERLALVLLALSLIGGTCSKPPPYHDVSGTWVVDSWGPGATMKADNEDVDFDVAITVQAPVPKQRGPVPVSGTVCVRDPKLGMSGNYTVDASKSVYEGSDYGGARLDLVAVAPDGRTIQIDQAFMTNASPSKLAGAILHATQPGPAKKISFRFVDFTRRSDVTCP